MNGGEYYYFQKNLQGDIVKVFDDTRTLVAQYAYDAWGSPLYVKDGSGNDVSGEPAHIGNINPFRYRGYYYDTDTGYYYLQSRYYDPQVGRFLNADGIIGANGDLLAYNMFAYCSNQPLNRLDPHGKSFIEFIESIFENTGYAINQMAPAYAGCGTAVIADGPLPFGDIAALVVATILTTAAVGYGIYTAAKELPKIKEKDINSNLLPKNQHSFIDGVVLILVI